MAEKGFGVKDINLIGASGTPTIESPNNLNLNAVNVAISTNATIGGNLTVSGTVGIAGTLTYEDVTNVDAVGIITARDGIFIPDSKKIQLGNAAGNADLEIVHDTNNSVIRDKGTGSLVHSASGIDFARYGTADYYARFFGGGKVDLRYNGDVKLETSADGLNVTDGRLFLYNSSIPHIRLNKTSGDTASTRFIFGIATGNDNFITGSTQNTCCIKTGGNNMLFGIASDKKLEINSSGATVTGTLAATAVTGDGSGLTGIAVTEAPVTDYTISANGSSAYRIHGGGVDETVNNPDLYLIRGQKYRFNNTTGSSHPFEIRVSDGGSAYTDGVSGDDEGVQLFTVPYAAPASLVYQCTIHSGMVGNIYIRGGSSTANISNNANNRVITGGSGGNLNGEANLTFDGSTLKITGADDQDNFIVDAAQTQFKIHQDSTDGEVSLRAEDGSGNNYAKYMTFFVEGGSGSTEKLRINSDGKVGINENPITAQFEVKSAQLGGTAGNTQEVVRLHTPDVSNTTSYRFTNYRTSNGTSHVTSEMRFRRRVDSTDMAYFGLGDGYASIGYGNSEKMRMNSNGDFLVGNNSPNVTARISSSSPQFGGFFETTGNTAANGIPLIVNRQVDDGVMIEFKTINNVRFTINWNGSNAQYGGTSDYRVKQNIKEISNSLAKLKELKPKRFNFKWSPDRESIGFIAHELQEVVPQAVTGTKDEMYEDDETKPKYQNVDNAHIVPLLVAAVQELTAKVEALEAG